MQDRRGPFSVLIVCADEDVRSTAAAAAAKAGHRVTEAPTGKDAWDLLRTAQDPDVIVLDWSSVHGLGLPRFVSMLREQGRLAGTKLVAVVREADPLIPPEDYATAVRLPLEGEELLAAVRAAARS